MANGNNAVVRLVSDNTYTGLTTISSGRLMIGQGNASEPGSIVSDVLNNGTLDFNRVENISYGGAISGSGVVIKDAAGKLTLAGANTYAGGTTVNAGALLAGNSTGSATGSGPVTVGSGASLGGTGSIAGAVTMNAGAHLAPGTSVGTLTVGGLTLSPSCLLDYEIGSLPASDLTIISGSNGLLLNGGTVNVIPMPGFGAGEYRLLDYTGAFSGSVANLSIGSVPSGFTYQLIDNPANTSIDLLVSVPEPAALVSAAMLAPLLIRRRRRH